jgi:hypothetical protein
VDSLVCTVSPIAQFTNFTLANGSVEERIYTTQISVSNMTENVLDAFLRQLIVFSPNLNSLVLECQGVPDFSITSTGL